MMTTGEIVSHVPRNPDDRFWIPAHRRKVLQSPLRARAGITYVMVPAFDDLMQCFKKDGPPGEGNTQRPVSDHVWENNNALQGIQEPGGLICLLTLVG